MNQTSPAPSRRWVVDQQVVLLAGGVATAAAAGVAASSGSLVPLAALAVPALGIVLAGLQIAPMVFWAIGLAGLAFLPLGGVVDIGPAPALAAIMGIAVLGLATSRTGRRSGSGRMVRIPELLAIGLFAYTSLALLTQVGFGYVISPVLMLWALPVLFGYLAMHRLGPRRIAASLVGSALALTPLLVIERVSGVNPITSLFPDSANFERGTGVTATRFDLTRVQAGWSHPILLSLFLAAMVVLAFALAVEADNRKTSLRWSAATVVLAGACTLCISRSSVVVLGIAMAFVIACAAINASRQSSGGKGGLGAALFLATALTTTIALSPLGRSIVNPDGGELATSANYRDTLLTYVLGNNLIEAGPNRYPELVTGPNYFSIDNMYLLLGMQLGWVFILLLVAVVLSAAILALPRSANRWSRWYAGALLGLFVAHWYVASFGKEQMFLWMMVGLVLGLLSGNRASEDSLKHLRPRA